MNFLDAGAEVLPNRTDNATNSNESIFQNLPALRPFLAVLLGIIILGSLIGNFIEFIVFYQKQSLLTVSNRLILNLAITNFAMAVIVMPPILVSFVVDKWIFGECFCQVVGMMTSVFFSACIFTLVLISLDRYCAIVTPLRYTSRVTRFRIQAAVGIIWFLSVVISIPPLFGLSRFTYQREKHTCTIRWASDSNVEKIYVFVLTMVCFCAPFVLMIWVYATIFHAARSNHKRFRRSSSLSKQDHETNENRNLNGKSPNQKNGGRRPSILATSIGQVFKKDEWKAAKTSLVIVFAFSLCWIPYFACLTFNSIAQTPGYIPWGLESFSILLMMLDCMLNPVVYVFLNKAMRTEIVKIFCKKRPAFEVDSRMMENGKGELVSRRFARRSNSEPTPIPEGSRLMRKTTSQPSMIVPVERKTSLDAQADRTLLRFLQRCTSNKSSADEERDCEMDLSVTTTISQLPADLPQGKVTLDDSFD